jgi:FlgD Ig-like domain
MPKGIAAALADPATGTFQIWTSEQTYVVEAQAGETSRELEFYAGSREFIAAKGLAFKASHPVAIDLKSYPNPVRSFTFIRFAVPASATGAVLVKLSLYDMQGRLVNRLVSESMTMGWHSIRWDARDSQGRKAPAGAYRILLEAGQRRMTRPMQIIP